MPLDLTEVAASPDVDASDVIMTVSKPAERYWKRHQRHPSGSGSHPIVVVPSDSEDDSDDDDIAIVSVCPPPPSDNDDCIVESYQPPTETFCAVNPDRMLAVRPASDDAPAVDVSCTDSGLDLQFTTYSGNTDQPGAFLVHNMQNLGAWILSSQPSSSVKQPDVNSSLNTCSGDSAVLPCSSDFDLPLSIPSANGAHPQPPFSSDSVQFNTVQLQTGGILFDMGAAKVSANIDKTSVLSLSAKIQSSDDHHRTTLSFVGSISDRKTPTAPDFVSVQTGINRTPDDLNLSLVTVSPVASPDDTVASNDKVDSCCQKSSVSLDVNTIVDAALNDTVDGLLKQMSSRKEKPSKPDVLRNGDDVKQAHQTVNTDVVDNKDVACQRRFLSLLNPQPAGVSHAFSHVPTSSGSFALPKKRKSYPWTSSASGSKLPRLPLPVADSGTAASDVSAGGQPGPLVDCCCSCNGPASVEKLSHCLTGHPCCGTCLEKYVKALLTSTVKVWNIGTR